MNQNSDKEEANKVHKFASIAELFFHSDDKYIDYQKKCNDFINIVNAKYCVFNLYDNKDNCFYTVAISGQNSDVLLANKLFGFDLRTQKWPRNFKYEELIKLDTITQCSISDLIGSRISRTSINHVFDLLRIGESYIVKIAKNNDLLGYFIVFMDKQTKFIQYDEAILYSSLLGLVIVQELTREKLNISETKLEDVIDFLPDATFAINLNHEVILWNKAIELMTGVLSKDIIGKKGFAYALPFYGELRPHLIDILTEPSFNTVGMYNDLERGNNYISAQAFANNLYNGKGAWVYAKASPMHDHKGNIVGSIEIIRDISDQKQAEFELKSSEEKFENLFNRAPLGYQSLDEYGCFIEVNEAWLLTLGYEKNEVVGKWFGDFLDDGYVESFKERFPIFKSLGKIHSEFFMKHKNGTLKYISFEGRIGYKVDGSFEKTHCIIKDITEQKITNEKLLESEQTHKALFDFSGVGIGYYTIDGYVISYNSKAAKNMNGKPEDFVGKSIYDLFPKEIADVYYGRIINASQNEKSQDYEDSVPLPNGNQWFYSTYSRIFDLNGNIKGIQIISQDISDLKNKEERILYLSYHDQLTGLYNRRFFDEELSRLDTQRNYPLTLAMGDVNGLKLINDSFGHKAGDELLKNVAKAIKDACRQDDIIARIGGDEFSIILPNSEGNDAEKVIQRINKLVSLSKTGPLDVSISFGFETKYDESESTENIIKKTEDHMYRHKVNESKSSRNKTIDLIMNTLFEKNKREMNHSERVSQICVEIATAMNFEKDEINHIRSAGLMHDIGKIGIEENILNSQIILTNTEWQEVKKHPEIGYRILSSAPDFIDIAEDVFSHHERWDGNGYPRGLKEESISMFARIIAIADSFDAMISERTYRTYRKSMSIEDATLEVKKNAGTQFDPTIARVFVENVMKGVW